MEFARQVVSIKENQWIPPPWGYGRINPCLPDYRRTNRKSLVKGAQRSKNNFSQKDSTEKIFFEFTLYKRFFICYPSAGKERVFTPPNNTGISLHGRKKRKFRVYPAGQRKNSLTHLRYASA